MHGRDGSRGLGTTPIACRTSNGSRSRWRTVTASSAATTAPDPGACAGGSPVVSGVLQCRAAGRLLPHTRHNGAQQEGFAPFERMISRGRRFSAARAYVHPVKSRRNLDVRYRVLVTKIDFEGTRATGVTYRGTNGAEHRVRAAEVILCGGAFNSPQVLQLSGVGDADQLKALDIAPVQHLPGVGANLEDHLAVQLQHACTQPISMLGTKSKLDWPRIGLQWLVGRRGDGATNLFEAGGFIRSTDEAQYPDVMVVLAPFARQFDPDKQVEGPGYLMCVDTLVTEGRGTVKIASTDPTAYPKIQFNYLESERDRRDWATALRIGRAILDQPAFREFDGREVVPGPEIQTDEELVDWVARTGQTGLHPTSTCRMGDGEMAVVDPMSMRVHGIDGLRVVDGSVFPSCTNASTYSPVMMVAEKSADVILGNTTRASASILRRRLTSALRRLRRRPDLDGAHPVGGAAVRGGLLRPHGELLGTALAANASHHRERHGQDGPLDQQHDAELDDDDLDEAPGVHVLRGDQRHQTERHQQEQGGQQLAQRARRLLFLEYLVQKALARADENLCHDERDCGTEREHEHVTADVTVHGT
ncbi:MAG: GMC family oxidoreductase N-terminal domain-containing protein [Pseudonocardiales bacterium]|nr:GMC family oxidoreductase N-terminal domain-containing protein [Pseudonocardiales bacterium]